MLLSRLTIVTTITAAAVALASAAAARSENVLYSFRRAQGVQPVARLLLDKETGALYGTTPRGGVADGGPVGGTVFKLAQSNGQWKATVIFNFGTDVYGRSPYAGLIEDSTGALYGTTHEGGSSEDGTVFELTRSGDAWNEQVLHSFTAGNDGAGPATALTLDKATGEFYGTTWGGGYSGCGTVFNLAQSGGSWKEKVIFSFLLHKFDDCERPASNLHEDSSGALFGLSDADDGYYGTAYRLRRSGRGGEWQEDIIHTFGTNGDGSEPADMVLAPDGTIYGTTLDGGSVGSSCGILFELTFSKKVWSETIIWDFGAAGDGCRPRGVYLDSRSGALYATTEQGGAHDTGTVAKFAQSGGTWTEKILYSFGYQPDGELPYARVIEDEHTGTLYGTTAFGGAHGQRGLGTAFEIVR
ncbi:MAG: choice-of-anchor tandem repeat GloVer-containing protein [Rhizomicrobium sp.]